MARGEEGHGAALTSGRVRYLLEDSIPKTFLLAGNRDIRRAPLRPSNPSVPPSPTTRSTGAMCDLPCSFCIISSGRFCGRFVLSCCTSASPTTGPSGPRSAIHATSSSYPWHRHHRSSCAGYSLPFTCSASLWKQRSFSCRCCCSTSQHVSFDSALISTDHLRCIHCEAGSVKQTVCSVEGVDIPSR